MNLRKLTKVLLIMGMMGCALSASMTVYAETAVVINNGAVKINNVPIIKQFPELPTGCEATALTMLLKYYGVNVSKQDVANTIVRVPLQYYKNNTSYGGNPNEGFVGNPYTSSSYGVFEKPIIAAINKYLPGRAENLTGKTFDEVLEVVKGGRPVMIWATIGMSNVSYTRSWRLETGEIFKWPNGEHALILVGYDSTYVYLNDPYTGSQRKFKRETVENRYNSLGKRAVAIASDEVSLKVKVNGESLQNLYEQEAIYKENKVLIPVSYLGSLAKDALASYRDHTVYLQINGEEVALDEKHNKVTAALQDKVESELYYEINEGVTRIDLDWVTRNLPITYSLNDKSLAITANEILKLVVDEEPILTKDGREILSRGGKIFIPITYIKDLGEGFDYEYIDKKVHLKLNGVDYSLEKDKAYIEVLLEDGTTEKIYYLVENGNTQIEFKGLAQYMNLAYEIQDCTIYVKTHKVEEPQVEAITEESVTEKPPIGIEREGEDSSVEEDIATEDTTSKGTNGL